MNAYQVHALLEIPYKEGGTGDGGYNCWGFLDHCLVLYFGKKLPAIPIGDPDGVRTEFKGMMESGYCSQVQSPEHGDPVLLRGGDHPHVGIYLNLDGGGVLHCLEGAGVVWTPARDLSRAGYARRTYYRIHHASILGETQQSVPPDR